MMTKMNAPELGRHKAISDRYMSASKFDHKYRRTMKQLLYGTFQTQKRDHFMRPAAFASATCVLCAGIHKEGPQMDGCGHVMGGCQHPQLHARYITRHNEAVALIAQAITEGEYGRWLVVADLKEGERDSLSERVRGRVQNRLPEWMLPHMAAEERNKMRPDLMFVIGAEENRPEPDAVQNTGRRQRAGGGPQQTVPDPARRRVVILEVGYARDSNMAEKLDEKMKQHQALAEALRHPAGPGQSAWETEIVPIVLGHCGSVLKSSMDAMRKLGVSKEATTTAYSRTYTTMRSPTQPRQPGPTGRTAVNLEAGRRWLRKRKKSG
jgi:hypothetical protein